MLLEFLHDCIKNVDFNISWNFFFINLRDLVAFEDGKIGKTLNTEIFLSRI